MIFPIDIHLIITFYLNDLESNNYLKYNGCPLNKYNAKECYDIEDIHKYDYIIRRVTINTIRDKCLYKSIIDAISKIYYGKSRDKLFQNITQLTFGSEFNQRINSSNL